MKLINFFIQFCLLFFIVTCSSTKEEVSKFDIDRIIQRVSEVRVGLQMKANDINSPLLNDYQIFVKACNTYRVNESHAMIFLKQTNVELFAYLDALKNELYN